MHFASFSAAFTVHLLIVICCSHSHVVQLGSSQSSQVPQRGCVPSNCYKSLVPAHAEPSVTLPVCGRAATGPDTQIIGRTSDEVDVLRNNEWLVLLCRITGRTCRVVRPYALALPACH